MKVKKSNIIIFLLYVIFLFIVASRHEPWSDEAQAWLISRDASVFDIIFKMGSYEGAPVLWHLILKFFIFLGLPYTKFYLVSGLISCLGVGFFLFKSPFPLWFRGLVPFTYFVFYQYGVLSRSYCLILLAVSLLAYFYSTRFKKPYHYMGALIFASLICAPMTLFCGFLFLLWLYDYSKEKVKDKNIVKAMSIIGGVFVFIGITCFPQSSNTSEMYINPGFAKTVASLMDMGAKSFLTNGYRIPISFSSTFFMLGLAALYWGKTKTLLRVLYLIVPPVVFLATVHADRWHAGIIFLIAIFCLWIYFDKDKFDFKKNKVFCFFVICILLLNVKWSINSSLYDVFSPYSGSKAAAQFLRENNVEEKGAFGVEYLTTSIEPYFDKKIFVNRKNSYWLWSKENETMYSKDIMDNLPDIIVLNKSEIDFLKNIELYQRLYQDKNRTYTHKTFVGRTYIKNAGYYYETYDIYVKKPVSMLMRKG